MFSSDPLNRKGRDHACTETSYKIRYRGKPLEDKQARPVVLNIELHPSGDRIERENNYDNAGNEGSDAPLFFKIEDVFFVRFVILLLRRVLSIC